MKIPASRNGARASTASHPYPNAHNRMSLGPSDHLAQKRRSIVANSRIGNPPYSASGARADAGNYGRTPQPSRAVSQ